MDKLIKDILLLLKRHPGKEFTFKDLKNEFGTDDVRFAMKHICEKSLAYCKSEIDKHGELIVLWIKNF